MAKTEVAVDTAKMVAGLEEQIRVLRGQLEAAIHGDAALLNSEQRVQAILAKHEEERRSGGEHRYFLFDSRDRERPPVEFYSDATTTKAALRDWLERTGTRYVGPGAEPWEVRTESAQSK